MLCETVATSIFVSFDANFDIAISYSSQLGNGGRRAINATSTINRSRLRLTYRLGLPLLVIIRAIFDHLLQDRYSFFNSLTT